ncbi:MAG: DUF2203 domain-containing protein, partial [Terriglobales bacterium]
FVNLPFVSKRTFSLDEAHALLPVLQSLLRRGMEAKQRVEEIEAEFQKLNHRIFLSGGLEVDVVTLARRRAESDKSLQQIKDSLAEIESTGAQVKDMDSGLLDFPCVVEGETILLCWKLGEERITHWHGVEEGFAGRKPIDQRIARAKGKSN